MSTLKHDLEQKEREAVEAREQANEAGAFWRFFRAHPEVIANEANRHTLREYHNGETISLKSLEESLALIPGRLCLQSETEERGKLEDEILSLVASSDGARTSEQNKFKYMETEQLRNRASELRERKAMKQKSVDELREIVHQEPLAADDLPERYGKEYLLALDGPTFRKFVLRYGSAALDRRLQGDSNAK